MKELIAYLDKILMTGEIRLGYDSTSGILKINEKDRLSKIKSISIIGCLNECFAFKMDGLKKNRKTHLLLKHSIENIHKGADAIIFCEYQKQKYILICELKSDKPKGFETQMKTSQAFVDYLLSLSKKLKNIDVDSIKIVNVLFSTRIQKQPIVRKRLLEKLGGKSLIKKQVGVGDHNINIRDILGVLKH